MIRVGFLLALLLLPVVAQAQLPSPREANVQQVNCTGDGAIDTAALSTAIATASASPLVGTELRVHGRCVVETPLTATFATTVALTGDGPGVTTFTFRNATDGFAITLTRRGNQWGGFIARGFSVIRGPATPAMANIGLSVVADQSAGALFAGIVRFSDLWVQGERPGADEWKVGVNLTSLVGVDMSHVTIPGIAPNGTDRGDVGLAINGTLATVAPNSMPAVQIGLHGVIIAGHSCGVCVTGFVQGVNIGNNSAIIADYEGIRWDAFMPAGPPLGTASDSRAGSPLRFAPASLDRIRKRHLVTGPGIATFAQVTGIDPATGGVTLSPAPAVDVPFGAAFAFHDDQLAEALTVTNTTLDAEHADIDCIGCSLSSVSNTSLLRHDKLVSAGWYGMLFTEGNNNEAINNSILGIAEVGTVSTGIAFSNQINPGVPNVAVGNTISNLVGGPGIHMIGRTTNVVAAANNCNGCFGGGAVQDMPGNTLVANNLNGVADTSYLGGSIVLGSATQTTVPGFAVRGPAGYPKAYQMSGPGGLLWELQSIGPPTSVPNTGDNFGITRFGDGGAPIDSPLTINRWNGALTAVDGLTVGSHLGSVASALPALTGCGRSPALSATATDLRGTVTEGAASSGCTITFAQPYAAPPDCVVASPNGAAIGSYRASVRALTITNPPFDRAQFTYQCIQ